MLWKVLTVHPFSEECDRVGVIEATTIQEAVAKLTVWFDESLQGGSYSLTREPVVTAGVVAATVNYRVHDSDGHEGIDGYLIQAAPDTFMFLAQDWHQVFAS